jgi:threonine/homoserine/homoserine lactone efflux protein
MNASLMNTQMLLTFCMTTAVIVAVPGPSAMFIVSRAISVGRPAAIAAAAGNTLGTTFQGLLAACGVGTLIGKSALLYNVIKLGGAAYLVAMGAKTIRHREVATVSDESSNSDDRRRAVRQGLVVGATNPKTLVFFAAALPQFVDPSRGYVIVQMLVLLAVYSLMSLVGDTSWGFAGGSLRAWSANSPLRIERMIAVGGLCIVGVGIAMALSQSVS